MSIFVVISHVVVSVILSFMPVLALCSCSLMLAYFVVLPICWHTVIVCLIALVVISSTLTFVVFAYCVVMLCKFSVSYLWCSISEVITEKC